MTCATGAHVNWLTQITRRTPLHVAAAAGHTDIVSMLLQKGTYNCYDDCLSDLLELLSGMPKVYKETFMAASMNVT